MSEIAHYIPGIFLIYGVFLLQNASPGPNVLAVMGISMSSGKDSGIALGAGVAGGTLTWSLFSVMGLSAIIASYGQLLIFIKIAGGSYLMWLAYKSFRSAWSNFDLDAPPNDTSILTRSKYFQRGFILNMSNPKAALGWIAIVSLGLDANAPAWVGMAIVIGTTLISLVVHIAYATLFSTSRMTTLYAKARRPVQGTLGCLFSFAGYKLLTTKIQ